MGIYKKQPGFCSNCGAKDEYMIDKNRPVICSEECRKDLERKFVLCARGKEYYPLPEPKLPF